MKNGGIFVFRMFIVSWGSFHKRPYTPGFQILWPLTRTILVSLVSGKLQLWTPRSRPEGTRLREVPLLYMVTKIVFLSHSLLFPPVWEKKVSALRMLMLDILASCFPRLV